jgi:hypothetical protein
MVYLDVGFPVSFSLLEALPVVYLNGVTAVVDDPQGALDKFKDYCRQWSAECGRTFAEEVLVMIDEIYEAP